jgi:hypothetical protein
VIKVNITSNGGNRYLCLLIGCTGEEHSLFSVMFLQVVHKVD